METVLRNTRPGRKQMFLDPRSKLALCLTVFFVTLAGDGMGIMKYVQVVLAVIPIIFFLILGKVWLSVYYTALYAFSMTVPYLLAPHLPPVANLLFTGIIVVSTQMIPAMSMFCFLVITTSVPEFVAAMDRMHMPRVVTVPLSSMFRFFPTIAEESSAIRDAMRQRKTGSIRQPMEMLEYRFVPLLMSLVSIGNDLSASALTRGLDAPGKRTSVCVLRFRAADILVLVFCAAAVALLSASQAFGL